MSKAQLVTFVGAELEVAAPRGTAPCCCGCYTNIYLDVFYVRNAHWWISHLMNGILERCQPYLQTGTDKGRVLCVPEDFQSRLLGSKTSSAVVCICRVHFFSLWIPSFDFVHTVLNLGWLSGLLSASVWNLAENQNIRWGLAFCSLHAIICVLLVFCYFFCFV